MVVLNNLSVSDKSNKSPQSRNVIILEKLRQAKAQAQLKNDHEKAELEKSSKRRAAFEKFKARQSSSSSSSSPESKQNLVKISALQEQLFTMQCKRSKQNYSSSDAETLKIKQKSELTLSSSGKIPTTSAGLEQEISSKKKLYESSSHKSNEETATRTLSTDNVKSQNGFQKKILPYEKPKKKMVRPVAPEFDDSDSSSDCEKPKLDENPKPDNEIGLLHLKEPLVNQQNEFKYYESRGRMEPIDWSVVNNISEDEKSTGNNTSVTEKKKKESGDQIQKFSKDRPDADVQSKEFINFVENTTTCKTVYEIRSNLEADPYALDTPILKIQRMINNGNENVGYMTQEIKEVFKSNSQQKVCATHIVDSYNKKPKSPTPVQREEIKPKESLTTDKMQEKVETFNQKCDENEEFHKFPFICVFDSKDTLSTLKLTNDVNQTRNKAIMDYNDDMFDFQLPATKSETVVNSTNLTNAVQVSKKSITDYTNDMFNFQLPEAKSETATFINSTISSSNSIENSSKSKNTISEYLNNTMGNTTYDSDDLSIPISRESENSSISRKSIKSKFEVLRNKLKSKSAENAPKPSVNVMDCMTTSQNNVDEIKTDNGELLLKEKSTRYFRKSNNELANVNNVVKDEDIKTTREEEPFLKPLSTRYFKKSPLEVQGSQEIYDKKNNEIQNVSKRMEKINLNVSSSEEKHLEKIDHLDLHQKTVEEKSEDAQKIYNINCVLSSDNETISDLSESNAKSSDSDSESDKDNFYKQNDAKSSVVIEEINSNSDMSSIESSSPSFKGKLQKVTSTPNFSEPKLVTSYQSVDSDEEFDIVNIEEFLPFQSLVNNLKKLQNSVTAQMPDSENRKASSDGETNDLDKSFSNFKSIESSLDISENNCSNISASVSSNLDSDTDTKSADFNSFSKEKNIFKNIKFDNIEWKESTKDYLNLPKKSNLTAKNGEIISKRKKKMTTALKNYQKNRNSKSTGEGSKEVQESADIKQTASSGISELTKRHTILNEIKKLKLHLSCKPLQNQNLMR